ncbi:HAMP domain-containing sensor histidine kinase [Anaerococcus porci]|uniref:sensor histidine kinase n=1 Tax=Anaerococcus porci TaxID=2652269 RepID=UPI002A750DA6|nr:HAMP domain-containing sensor histidine kinase [Anaerococcus porci]MDY3006776.1 HAMP domain-containing sensor histidine kinase [Anaerococcus porci]
MVKFRGEIKFNRFLFLNLIIIVSIVYGYYIISSITLDSIGSNIFSKVANQYSADYIFDNNRVDKENLNKIRGIDGWIFIINEDLSLDYTSNDIAPNNYNFKDIINLNKGIYEYNGKKYFGSVKSLTNNKYGVVVVPSKYIKNQILLTPQKQNLNLFILFFVIRILIFILGTFIVLFLFSRLLFDRLHKPLEELEYGFSKLKEEKYSFIEDSNNRIKITEFSYIRDAFNSTVESLRELKNERIENKARRMQLFVDIRHDLKTPITVIKGFSEALINKKIAERDLNKYLKAINKNAIIIDSLLNQMSEIIEYEDYKYKLNLEIIDICEYMRQSIIDFLPVFEQHNIETEIKIPEEQLFVEIDKNIFNRAIKNLMQNLVDHNMAGRKAYFEIKCCSNKILVIIGDTGCKINEKIAQNIFDPFVTDDSSRNSANKNKGLGLAITKKIVELHQGRIYLTQQNTNSYTKYFTIELEIYNYDKQTVKD